MIEKLFNHRLIELGFSGCKITIRDAIIDDLTTTEKAWRGCIAIITNKMVKFNMHKVDCEKY